MMSLYECSVIYLRGCVRCGHANAEIRNTISTENTITYAWVGGACLYKADVVHTLILVLSVHGVKSLIQDIVSTQHNITKVRFIK